MVPRARKLRPLASSTATDATSKAKAPPIWREASSRNAIRTTHRPHRRLYRPHLDATAAAAAAPRAAAASSCTASAGATSTTATAASSSPTPAAATSSCRGPEQ